VGESGAPSLYIFRDCKELIRQIKGYRWKQGPKNIINPKDAPIEVVSADNHLVDCLRYGVFSTDGTPVKSWAPAVIRQEKRNFFSRK
jgi:hypothetical protein